MDDIICMGINRGCWDAAQTAGLRIHRADAKRLFGGIQFCGEPIDWDTIDAIDTQTTERGFKILCVWPTGSYDKEIHNASARFDLSQPFFHESL